MLDVVYDNFNNTVKQKHELQDLLLYYIFILQIRYFKLTRDGYISYSVSKEDNNGTKGSIKIDKMILQVCTTLYHLSSSSCH